MYPEVCRFCRAREEGRKEKLEGWGVALKSGFLEGRPGQGKRK